MPVSNTTAVDVALLPTSELRTTLHTANRMLSPPPNGFYFDRTHLPHLTLVQQFILHDDIELLSRKLEFTLQAYHPLELTTTNVSAGGESVLLNTERTAPLMALHLKLMDTLIPFITNEGSAESFDTNDDIPRDADIAWVKQFRERSAYDYFSPHWTLGVGAVLPAIKSHTAVFNKIALLSLGRFCTCRRVLASWTLTASG